MDTQAKSPDRQQSAEVEALVRCHNLALEDACRMAGLPLDQYTPEHGVKPLAWMPRPADIEAAKRAFRARWTAEERKVRVEGWC